MAASGAVLVLIGLWGILARPNLFKIAIATSVMETGVNLVILSVGYIRGTHRAHPRLRRRRRDGGGPHDRPGARRPWS
ncbi:MAG: NADH-quinone oxidoreductase subunit K [Chromatiales bacterium]|nr:NADH-quinone oxidoreductase subunit K [Chromatiales bacterium]